MSPTYRVGVPARHEGIGLALRCAFLPRAHDLPSDLDALLDKLK